MSGLRIKGLGEEIATLANLPWDQPLLNWPEDDLCLGEELGIDVGLDFATADYIEKVLLYRMDSGVVINR
jgi:hypothetical protein